MELTIKQQTITSREIAEMAGKQHKHVMEAIRKMEPAWEKVHGSKFGLTFITRQLPNGGSKKDPQYLLTKTETLYIATKFNDEARARLVLRWEELEKAEKHEPLDVLRDIDSKLHALQSETEKLHTVRNTLLTLYGTPCIEKEGWKELFIENFGEELYIHIRENIQEWVSTGEIPSSDFNERYSLYGVSSRKFLRAIGNYCANNGIEFNPHKTVRLNKKPARVRIFS